MADFMAWAFMRLGWLPHRYRGWVKPWMYLGCDKPRVVMRLGKEDHILLATEARWLASELLLAARDADVWQPTRSNKAEPSPSLPNINED